ncbi:AraC family transcriptional regulator [Serinibacter arcticus]|uniref:AraC family transcriptional regulator n=1 Tax=Serinibacter arcticus TaxID=1655435 RepID=A0A2U1ZVY6_9MICO|nr:AraC family transcriptional regulator [Serinibacter arcticus]PWD51157.1 AraC family transcriptional regulator [Serinibacter arcticus]
MKPDSPIARAHLVDPADTSHAIARLPAQPDLADLVRWFWIPVWSVPDGEARVQEVLRYPVCLVVVAPHYARFYGVDPGLSRTTLTGDGWAFGLALQPAAGSLLTGAPMDAWRGTTAELADILGSRGAVFTARVRALLGASGAAATDPAVHREAAEAARELLAPALPVDEEGRLVNALVEWVETTPEVLRVEQIRERFDLTERGLQRLCQRRIGLGPKWLIQRRRLHEAVGVLRGGATGTGTRTGTPDGEAPPSLADVASSLGYADQAHFTRDLRAATGMTPGQLAARYRV